MHNKYAFSGPWPFNLRDIHFDHRRYTISRLLRQAGSCVGTVDPSCIIPDLHYEATRRLFYSPDLCTGFTILLIMLQFYGIQCE